MHHAQFQNTSCTSSCNCNKQGQPVKQLLQILPLFFGLPYKEVLNTEITVTTPCCPSIYFTEFHDNVRIGNTITASDPKFRFQVDRPLEGTLLQVIVETALCDGEIIRSSSGYPLIKPSVFYFDYESPNFEGKFAVQGRQEACFELIVNLSRTLIHKFL